MMLKLPLRPRIAWRFLWLFLIPNAVIVAAALVTDAHPLIFWLNSVVVALAVCVCIAFAPAIFKIFTEERDLDRADIMAFGVWLSWFSIILRTGLSLVWRLQGAPMWMVNTDYSSYYLFMTAFAAACHVAAPGALAERVPVRKWTVIGLIAAAAVLAAIAVSTLLNHTDLVEFRSWVG